MLAIVAVGGAVGFRSLLEGLGQFYYLPMVPAVVITALLTRRMATALAVILSIVVNLTLVPRESLTDAATNAVLFAAVSWVLAEICWAMRAMQGRTRDLSRQLATKDAMLNTALASVPVVTLNAQGEVHHLNPAAAALFDLTEAAAVGCAFSRLAPGFEIDAILATGAVGGALAAKESHWTGLRPDGATFPLSIQFGVALDPAGETHVALCLTDLSRWHAADAQARELHAQLNKVWRLNSLGEMAATLAHELNQPLSAAATYLHASHTPHKVGHSNSSEPMGLSKRVSWAYTAKRSFKWANMAGDSTKLNRDEKPHAPAAFHRATQSPPAAPTNMGQQRQSAGGRLGRGEKCSASPIAAGDG